MVSRMTSHSCSLLVLLVILVALLAILVVSLTNASSYLLLQLQAIQGYGNHEPPDDSGGGLFQMFLEDESDFMQGDAGSFRNGGSDGVGRILATIHPSLRDDRSLPARRNIILPNHSRIMMPHFGAMYAFIALVAIRQVEPFAAAAPQGLLDLGRSTSVCLWHFLTLIIMF
ncbi:PREDICTED: uncharacterized protein LOC109586527 [Amphimedon queenslandica]|uniref:Uncharacterized protein n=1 Tax=Amphimedon queenslandica TaxID=400682 RepID=A0AAN0JNB4_AMPQE|nr:PREDICTED: uncharacterized protein LOC109586527 [Amphimedon queenslandica]|eukprot:XP_019858285.1 PREDICTED: uncharacterized protein LOC109586527 [Amphimedon queenslandica]